MSFQETIIDYQKHAFLMYDVYFCKEKSMITCFSAFLLCFCDEEMTLPAGMVGDGQPE